MGRLIFRKIFIGSIFLIFAGCALSDAPQLVLLSDYYDFNEGTDGWQVDFADYPAGENDSINYGLTFAHTSLPGNLSARKGIMISGVSYNEDLFMFVKKKVTGLPPETVFSVTFQVEMASNIPAGSVTGTPESSVVLKAGASELEPKKISNDGLYRLNVSNGSQMDAGENFVSLGHIASSSNSTDYQLITRSSENNYAPFYARSNSDGELWLIVGTDSGFEGRTTVYYTRLNFLFTYSE